MPWHISVSQLCEHRGWHGGGRRSRTRPPRRSLGRCPTWTWPEFTTQLGSSANRAFDRDSTYAKDDAQCWKIEIYNLDCWFFVGLWWVQFSYSWWSLMKIDLWVKIVNLWKFGIQSNKQKLWPEKKGFRWDQLSNENFGAGHGVHWSHIKRKIKI